MKTMEVGVIIMFGSSPLFGLSFAYIRKYKREVFVMSYLYFTFEGGGRFMRIHF
jgi:hypothetical protein